MQGGDVKMMSSSREMISFPQTGRIRRLRPLKQIHMQLNTSELWPAPVRYT